MLECLLVQGADSENQRGASGTVVDRAGSEARTSEVARVLHAGQAHLRHDTTSGQRD